jgi:hypothetical protein
MHLLRIIDVWNCRCLKRQPRIKTFTNIYCRYTEHKDELGSQDLKAAICRLRVVSCRLQIGCRQADRPFLVRLSLDRLYIRPPSVVLV